MSHSSSGRVTALPGETYTSSFLGCASARVGSPSIQKMADRAGRKSTDDFLFRHRHQESIVYYVLACDILHITLIVRAHPTARARLSSSHASELIRGLTAWLVSAAELVRSNARASTGVPRSQAS